MGIFKLVSPFKAAADQPRAIEKLSQNILNGVKQQTLLGVTGSGKTFTMAGVIEKLDRPVLIMSPNKVLAAQLYGEFKELFVEALAHLLMHIDGAHGLAVERLEGAS